MTLILALANEEYVIQVADRRLSHNGQLIDDESNKSGYLISDDSKMLFGFTGLAEYGTFKTRRWILDTLSKSKSNHIREIYEEFRENATAYFNSHIPIKKIPRAHKRLSIMFTGFVEHGLIGNCIITNYQDFNSFTDAHECFDDFRVYAKISNVDTLSETTFVQRIGSWRAMTDSDERDLRVMLSDKKPRKAVENKAVSLVRKMSDRTSAGGTIGKQINCISLEKSSESPISQYYSTELKSELYLADMIDLRADTHKIQISDIKLEVQGVSISIPKVGRNHPCPCGSGLKYKKCHGR